MKVIYKYNMREEKIQIPKWSKILCIQLQNDEPHIWILVDTNECEFEIRELISVGTGESFDDKDMNYIGTYQQGIFV